MRHRYAGLLIALVLAGCLPAAIPSPVSVPAATLPPTPTPVPMAVMPVSAIPPAPERPATAGLTGSTIHYLSPEMGFEVDYPASWAMASGASEPSRYGVCDRRPQPCRTAGFLLVGNAYYVSVTSWPAGLSLADAAARGGGQGAVLRPIQVGGEPALEVVRSDGPSELFVAHAGWVYSIGFPPAGQLPDRPGLPAEWAAFLSTFRFVAVAPTPAPTRTPTPTPPVPPAPTPTRDALSMAPPGFKGTRPCRSIAASTWAPG